MTSTDQIIKNLESIYWSIPDTVSFPPLHPEDLYFVATH